MITGIFLRVGMVASLARNSKPSRRGISRSSTMQSGQSSASWWTASSPSRASTDRQPWDVTRRLTTRRTENESSTTSTVNGRLISSWISGASSSARSLDARINLAGSSTGTTLPSPSTADPVTPGRAR